MTNWFEGLIKDMASEKVGRRTAMRRIAGAAAGTALSSMGGTALASVGRAGSSRRPLPGPLSAHPTSSHGSNTTRAIPNGIGSIVEYALPAPHPQSPFDITTGPDQLLWFTDSATNSVGKSTTVGAVTLYALPPGVTQPFGITSGPDGNLWFTLFGSNQIGKVTTLGVFTIYPIPTANSAPWDITAGPDGNLWFTESAAGKIGRITTSGVVTEYPLPNASSQPLGITSAFGSLWFCEFTSNKIGKITTVGVISEFQLPPCQSGPVNICQGPKGDKHLWFTEFNADRIGKIAPSFAPLSLSAYSLTSGARPFDIAPMPYGFGSANGLWFTESGLSNIGHLYTPSNAITEYPTSTLASQPYGITLGPNPQYYWFTEFAADNIAQVQS
ncbi:MAG: Virginiamycin B lyase [Ktedonobacteraceae bacterium]